MRITPMAKSACVYVECPITGMVLAVSRRDNPDDFGLPGGKLNAGFETETQCAQREFLEETGCFVSMNHLYEVIRRDDCVTFRADFGYVYRKQAPENNGGRVQWVTKEKLMEGSFGDYNRNLLKAVGKMRG